MAQLPQPGQLCQLVECMWELRDSMELLTTFTDRDVLHNDAPSHWVKITPSRPSKPAEPAVCLEQSWSRNRRAHTWGSFSVNHSMGWAKPTITAPVVSSLTISSHRLKTPPGSPSTQKWKPLPSFAEIARSLWGNNPLHISIEVPPELTTPQSFLVGTATATLMSTKLQQDMVAGTTYLELVTTSMSLVSLEVTPTAVDHPMPTWEGWEDMESNWALPSSHNSYFCWQLLTLDLYWTVTVISHVHTLSIPYPVNLLAVMPLAIFYSQICSSIGADMVVIPLST